MSPSDWFQKENGRRRLLLNFSSLLLLPEEIGDIVLYSVTASGLRGAVHLVSKVTR
jgi:hypothetical protein